MRDKFFLLSQVLALIFTIVVAYASWWIPWKAKIGAIRIIDIIKQSALDFSTPTPWIPTLFLLYIVFVVKSEKFSKKVADCATTSQKLSQMNEKLSQETEGHRDTRENYYKSVQASLKYILTQNSTGFNDSCRVSIFKIDSENSTLFRNIFRHAAQQRYNAAGRDIIPTNEGLIGLAWQTTGTAHFRDENECGTETFTEAMREKLDQGDVNMPPASLRMPSRELLVRSLSDHDDDVSAGVIVYESTNIDALHREEIEKLLTDEALTISRLVKYLGVLDEVLNPYDTR